MNSYSHDNPASDTPCSQNMRLPSKGEACSRVRTSSTHQPAIPTITRSRSNVWILSQLVPKIDQHIVVLTDFECSHAQGEAPVRQPILKTMLNEFARARRSWHVGTKPHHLG